MGLEFESPWAHHIYRSVDQFGKQLRLGRRQCEFKSHRSDQVNTPVAERHMHLTQNKRSMGSSPIWGTKKKKKIIPYTIMVYGIKISQSITLCEGVKLSHTRDSVDLQHRADL